MAVGLFAVLFCFVAAAISATHETSACSRRDSVAAARFAVHVINAQRLHGFKFKLVELVSSKYQKDLWGVCYIALKVKLLQTKCHFTNPKSHERCDLFRPDERGAAATCDVKLYVMGRVGTVTRYNCVTKPEPSNKVLAQICPGCPTLSPLDDPTALKAAREATLRFNRDGKRRNYFALMEVAQVLTGYIVHTGTITWLQLVLVETMCLREDGLRNRNVNCAPRCPDKATYYYCLTDYDEVKEVLGDLDCDSYSKNPRPTAPDAWEPTCQLFNQSPKASACKAQLNDPNPDKSVHHICPFPLK
ncbi:antihemorrhagic factor cHLP-B-like [Corythoichthys intestinalis]|uniref:antihemorrhagic factor cHLP-B-like n=1 Tax=Corythoichthys intestinalis TaxID=161448 RepID=UPI0025A66A2D|nr:antihemorrhagic factor cHLP-B-like [Corythoichthys intestinalis]